MRGEGRTDHNRTSAKERATEGVARTARTSRGALSPGQPGDNEWGTARGEVPSIPQAVPTASPLDRALIYVTAVLRSGVLPWCGLWCEQQSPGANTAAWCEL